MSNEKEPTQWHAGQPVRTSEDVVQWQAWKKKQVLEGQRFRRSIYRRIDYYPSETALELIERHMNGRRTYAQIIDALLLGEVPE